MFQNQTSSSQKLFLGEKYRIIEFCHIKLKIDDHYIVVKHKLG